MTKNQGVVVGELFVSPPLAKQKVTSPRLVNDAVVDLQQRPRRRRSVGAGIVFPPTAAEKQSRKKQEQIKNKETADNGYSTTKTATAANSVSLSQQHQSGIIKQQKTETAYNNPIPSSSFLRELTRAANQICQGRLEMFVICRTGCAWGKLWQTHA